jgi:hypothetical protein
MDMQRVLADADVLQLVAAQLTREEAGLYLAPLCKKGAEFVRAADAAADAGGREIWRDGVPMWTLARTLDRLACKYFEEGYCPGGLELLLASLVREIDGMRAAGVVELVFDRAAACDGKQASLLGCHTLRVAEPVEFLQTMEQWTVGAMRMAPIVTRALKLFARRTSSGTVLNLMKKLLGLRRPREKEARCGRCEHVARHEPLWYWWYVAV